jgi:hypothetical protein
MKPNLTDNQFVTVLYSHKLVVCSPQNPFMKIQNLANPLIFSTFFISRLYKNSYKVNAKISQSYQKP